MAKPKYFKFSFPSGDPTGIARCAYDKAAAVRWRLVRIRPSLVCPSMGARNRARPI